ncbi:hypothetical protein [Haloferax sp. DFSO60]|uniref:hypothetical protein n=1 Tax=Haloferax sp. DFSO60 TaxID=3388652 RepID=UPI0039786C41
MISRRTRARAEFAVALFSALTIPYSRRKLRKLDDEKRAPTRYSPKGIALGSVWQIGYLWSYDRDIWKIRTRRRRRFLCLLFGAGVRRLVFPRTDEFTEGTRYGRVLGILCYRFWYGLLRPLPGTED